MNAPENNSFIGSLPREIELLTELSDLCLCESKYLVDYWSCLKVSCVANHILSVVVSYHKLLMCFSTLNATDNNDFTGSLSSKIGLPTGLSNINLGRWMYLVDHFDCLKVSCVTNHILSGFDSHHK